MQHHSPDRTRLELFHARGTDIAPCDAQDLMSWPFFSFATSLRVTPIGFRMGQVSISIGATIERDILRDRCLTVVYVRSGVDILLSARGWPNVEKVMKIIEAIDIVSPDYWRRAHGRRAAREAPSPDTRQRHGARLLRRRIEP
jgi:hypothetical protein